MSGGAADGDDNMDAVRWAADAFNTVRQIVQDRDEAISLVLAMLRQRSDGDPEGGGAAAASGEGDSSDDEEGGGDQARPPARSPAAPPARARAPPPSPASPPKDVLETDIRGIASFNAPVIYVLGLRHGKYYVGRTPRLPDRLREHYEGKGAAWTKHYPMERLLSIKYASQCGGAVNGAVEEKETMEWMARYGVDNVRGGTYAQLQYEPEAMKAICKQVWGSADLCLECGSGEHFATSCPSRRKRKKQEPPARPPPPVDTALFALRRAQMAGPLECERCGRNNHVMACCFCKTHRNGTALPLIGADA